MANSDTRFLYTDDDGNLIIVIPADNIIYSKIKKSQ